MQGAVRLGPVVVGEELSQDQAQVSLTEDQDAVEQFPRRVPIIRSQIAFARGDWGGLLSTRMPASASTVSKELVNWPPRSRIMNLNELARCPRSISVLRAVWAVQAPSGVRADPE